MVAMTRVAMMRRGEVWVADLRLESGARTGKARPVVVLQNDELSEAVTETLVVLPLTSQVRPGFRHLRISLPPRDRLLRPCQVMVDQPRTIARHRVGDGPLAVLTEDEMAAVERSLLAVMGVEVAG